MLSQSSKQNKEDKEVSKNYRPVSNLCFVSKILKRVVAVQLQTHLDDAGLMTAFKSAYRKHYSTLLNIQDNILLNMAKGSQPSPSWISLQSLIPLTIPLTYLILTMESVS